jgi:glutamate synthase domain-containing protein 2
MARQLFIAFVAATIMATAAAFSFYPSLLGWLVPAMLICVIGVRDMVSQHNVLRLHPVVGHLRYLLEFVRPELRQYFFESEFSGRPFNREQRTVIYRRAKNLPDTSPFGTLRDIEAEGANFVEHSLAPKTMPATALRVQVGGEQCRQPYNASRLNVSAMSFGSLSATAVEAINRGAHLGGFAQNTGEGSISEHHQHGGDLIWQLGTGYFGCRNANGRFDGAAFQQKIDANPVRMVELKLSQGAKPSHGGVLPAAKISREIARTRGIPMGEDCLSPPAHPEFDSPVGLLEFLQRLRELSGGLPVGFKLCIGRRHEFMAICKAMLETGIHPDFITVDGAEGGTGAAPVEFSDYLGTYINEALPFVHSCLKGIGLRDQIRIIASGKVAMGFDMVVKHALGADLCNAARPFMFSVGCIQARRCHNNQCPTGVATQDPRRAIALDPKAKAQRVANYHRNTLHAFRDLVGALGVETPEALGPERVFHRMQFGPAVSYAQLYPFLDHGALLGDDLHADFADDWRLARADRF